MPNRTEGNDWSLERSKLLHDYLKHLSTICTGSIVVMVTFMDKIAQNPEWQFLVGVSLMSLLIAVIRCVLVQTADILDFGHKEEWSSNIALLGLMSAWIGFLIGMVSLVFFGLKNLV